MNVQDPAGLQVVVVGGGMITHDQILPSLYHLQRTGRLGPIKISALSSAPLRALADDDQFAEAFPGQAFEPFPTLDTVVSVSVIELAVLATIWAVIWIGFGMLLGQVAIPWLVDRWDDFRDGS